MKTEEEIIADIKSQGYDNVYVWDAKPEEVDEEHSHEFDTKLHVLVGSIRIKLLESGPIDDFKLVSGSELEIGRNKKHSAIVGQEGCRYVVAEKH